MLTGAFVALGMTAFTLGLRHGFDPDHLAAIDGIARVNAPERPRLARLAGTFFSVGHGVVVMGIALAAGLLASRWLTPDWLSVTGSLISVGFLLGLAFINLTAVWKTPHHHVIVPLGLKSRWLAPSGVVRSPLAVMVVGAMFALSFDTISQTAMFAAAAGRIGDLGHILAVAALFVVGMIATDGLNGLWIARLIGRANRRAATASRIMTTTIGVVSLVVAGLTILTLASHRVADWLEGRNAILGVLVIVALTLAFVIAMQVTGKRKFDLAAADLP